MGAGNTQEAEETSERDILYKSIALTIKGHEPQVLKSYETFILKVCDNLGLNVKSETRNRPVFLRLSMNKSPFIYKKHQRQYEFRTHYKYVTVEKITGCTADVFLEYIQRNIPEGVAMEVARSYCSRKTIELFFLDDDQHRLESLPEPVASMDPATSS